MFGARLVEERVERRLAAVLVADVVGYSRLVGVDDEGTVARVKALRKTLIDPKIAEYRGRIVKNTGDGALVEFRSEERRVGKECVSLCRSRWSPYH